jgi:hypothetical protein
MIAFCASIKLGGSLISRPCLKHPPERSTILAFWAFDTGGWKRLNSITIHDLERNVLAGLFAQIFSFTCFFGLFSLKAAF